jgi:hypothetical protein
MYCVYILITTEKLLEAALDVCHCCFPSSLLLLSLRLSLTLVLFVYLPVILRLLLPTVEVRATAFVVFLSLACLEIEREVACHAYGPAGSMLNVYI